MVPLGLVKRTPDCQVQTTAVPAWSVWVKVHWPRPEFQAVKVIVSLPYVYTRPDPVYPWVKAPDSVQSPAAFVRDPVNGTLYEYLCVAASITPQVKASRCVRAQLIAAFSMAGVATATWSKVIVSAPTVQVPDKSGSRGESSL